jgi:hypothetical protein
LFLPDAQGRRPYETPASALWSTPPFRDGVLFYEYFNGDTGAGLGASHQTGWTGLVAKLLEQQAIARNAHAAAASASPPAESINPPGATASSSPSPSSSP